METIYKTKNLKTEKVNLSEVAVKLGVGDFVSISGLKFVEVFSLKTNLKAVLEIDDIKAYEWLTENTTEELIQKLLETGKYVWCGVVTKDFYRIYTSKKTTHLINKFKYSYVIDGQTIYEVLDADLSTILNQFMNYEFNFRF